MRKPVLVTGGAGFIGSHLVRALCERGYHVRIIDNLSSSKLESIDKSGGKSIWIDDLNAHGIADEVCRDVETVFHLAAIPSVNASIADPLATQKAGETATINLLNACIKQGVRRVIFASSASVYGDSNFLPYHETMVPTPISPYAASKLACEHYLRSFSKNFGLETISLRYFNVFGKGQSGEYSGVITKFLQEMQAGRRPIIYGDGTTTRDFVHVENIVNANILAMDCKASLLGAVCNIGSGERTSLNILFDELNKVLGKKLMARYEPRRAGDPFHSWANIDKAKELIGYEPKVGFSEGIWRLVNE